MVSGAGFRRETVTAVVVAMFVVSGCTSSISEDDERTIDRVTRAYYQALAAYDCSALGELSTDRTAACAQIPAEDQRTPMPTSVEFGAIVTEKGETLRKLTVGGGPCTLLVQQQGESWRVETPPGLSCS